MKSKLLCIAPYKFAPPQNGGQKCIYNQYEALANSYDLHVVSTRDNEQMSTKQYAFYPYLGSNNSKKRYFDLSVFNRIKSLINDLSISSLMIEHPYMGWMAHLLKKKTGVHVIVRSHNIEHLRFRELGRSYWPVLRNYEKWTYKMADSVLYITEEDRQWVENNWGLTHGQLFHYGTWRNQPVYSDQKKKSKILISEQLNVSPDTKIVLFNGTFDYLPNEKALEDIIENIAPSLLDQSKLKFVICGGGVSDRLQTRILQSENVLYAGYVTDINVYLEGADIFVNPVTLGGGIKTKLVESIAFGLDSISYKSGAQGIPLNITHGKLQIAQDYDHSGLAQLIRESRGNKNTPREFYECFNWYQQVEHLDLTAD